MQIAIVSTGVATLLFSCAILGFRWGLRLGMQTAKGQIPPKIAPVKAVKDALAKPDPATAELLKGHANMMAYDGFLPEEKQPKKR
jgi:hypothetical protein